MTTIAVKAPIATLLEQLNTIRIAKGMKALKKWGGTRGALVLAISRSGVSVTKAAPAVAEGAYVNDREAEAKTGHTTRGKTKKRAEIEKKKERIVASVTGTKTPKRTPAPTKERDPATFTLADWARDHKKEPKVVRSKARRHTAELAKLQVKGEKYVFLNKSLKAVTALLTGDHRKKGE